MADQENTEICPEYSLDTHTTDTANTWIATVPNTTHENLNLKINSWPRFFLHIGKTGVRSFLDKQQNKNKFYDLA